MFRDKSFLNVLADDSASQMHLQTSQLQNMRNNPFSSNLESAKMLAQLTRERVNALKLESHLTAPDANP